MSRKPRSHVAAALCLAVGVLAAGCTDDGTERGDTVTETTPTPTGPAPTLRQREAPYTITFDRVVGKVPSQVRKRARTAMSAPIRRWVERGFLAGPWPRARFTGAFGGFRPDVKQQARGDTGLLTMRRLGDSVTEVVAERRSIRITAVAPHRRVVGGTARVNLKVLAAGEKGEVRRVNVRGSFSLTPNAKGRWRIFAYDMDRWVDRDVSVTGKEGTQ